VDPPSSSGKYPYRRFRDPITGCYPIAIDGAQNFRRSYLWDEECLERKVRSKKDEENAEEQEEKTQYYVY